MKQICGVKFFKFKRFIVFNKTIQHVSEKTTGSSTKLQVAIFSRSVALLQLKKL